MCSYVDVIHYNLMLKNAYVYNILFIKFPHSIHRLCRPSIQHFVFILNPACLRIKLTCLRYWFYSHTFSNNVLYCVWNLNELLRVIVFQCESILLLYTPAQKHNII